MTGNPPVGLVRRGDLAKCRTSIYDSMYVVLAVSDGYVVLRRVGQKPLVVAERDVERWNG